MGKSYSIELGMLDETYRWAMKEPIDQLKRYPYASYGLPLLSVGSGGSLISAVFASLLHQHAGNVSHYCTPLELYSATYPLYNTSLLLISAGGNNFDIITCFNAAVKREPKQVVVLCGRKGSKLSHNVKNFRYVQLFEFKLPSGKDGFLATNSLLGFSVLLARTYQDCCSPSYRLPKTLDDLIDMKVSKLKNCLIQDLDHLLSKKTIVILYGKWGKTAALDLESRFTEAALVNVQLADFRNFAHGRHHWLAKHGEQSGIIALVSPEDEKIANRTIDLIPKNIPVAKLYTKHSNPVGALGLLIKGMYVTQVFGEVKGIDLGRPGVPKFGSRIYNLRTSLPANINDNFKGVRPIAQAAIARKICTNFDNLVNKDVIEFWIDAYNKFINKFKEIRFYAAVFDYDGTLCEPSNRFIGPSEAIANELTRLLSNGVIIGVATGRGKSVRQDLQKIIPRKHWSQVIIGYYNGSDLAPLDDNNHPIKDNDIDPTLKLFVDLLTKDRLLSSLVKYELRPKQVTVEPKGYYSVAQLFNLLQNFRERNNLDEIKVFESSHSVDVLAPTVSKLSIIDYLITHVGGRSDGNIVCIGDKGKWPGNDFELLKEPYSLSVDTVSADPQSCWNLAPAGYKGEQALTSYLRAAEITSNMIRIRCENVRPIAP